MIFPNCINILNYSSSQRYFEGETNNNYLFLNCFFQRLNIFIGNGAVLYFFQIIATLNINYCLFYNCSTNLNGRGIYFICENSKSLVNISNVCASLCSCGNSYLYPFSVFYHQNISKIEFTSINLCSYQNQGSESITLIGKEHYVNNLNSSKNYVYRFSGLYTLGDIFLENYCTFINNSVSRSICIFFHMGLINRKMENSNIINNNSPIDYGVIWNSYNGVTKMNFCIFSNNEDTLFYLESGNLILSNCKIYHNINKITYGSVVINNSILNLYFSIININHFYSFYCETEKNFGSYQLKFNSKKFFFLIFYYLIN